MPTLFLSDLHLCPERPEQIELFKQFLAGPARTAEAVYILGDLFEDFWLGDDDHTPPVVEIMAHLKSCAEENPNLFFLRGNRDLMVGHHFVQRSGCTLLPDEVVISMNGQPVLLMHGDLLCSNDVGYQRFRAFLEKPFIRKLFLSFPYFLRALLGHGLRPLIKQSSERKKPEIIDVDSETVSKTMRKHEVSLLIHGHTHRPAIHEMEINGNAAQRIVLGDWYEEELVLMCEGEKKELVRVETLL